MSTDRPPRFFQFRIRTLLLVIVAFAAGLVTRNFSDGLHPFTASFALPKSTSPLRPGDVLLVESATDKSINRKVTVLADHMVSLPYIGDVSVKSLTLKNLEDLLNKRYSKFFQAPGIQVYRADASKPTS